MSLSRLTSKFLFEFDYTAAFSTIGEKQAREKREKEKRDLIAEKQRKKDEAKEEKRRKKEEAKRKKEEAKRKKATRETPKQQPLSSSESGMESGSQSERNTWSGLNEVPLGSDRNTGNRGTGLASTSHDQSSSSESTPLLFSSGEGRGKRGARSDGDYHLFSDEEGGGEGGEEEEGCCRCCACACSCAIM